jgi:hypothetical protein
MKIGESNDKHFCNECNEYGYTWDIYVHSDFDEETQSCYPSLQLCKSCLLKLFKAILYR